MTSYLRGRLKIVNTQNIHRFVNINNCWKKIKFHWLAASLPKVIGTHLQYCNMKCLSKKFLLHTFILKDQLFTFIIRNFSLPCISHKSTETARRKSIRLNSTFMFSTVYWRKNCNPNEDASKHPQLWKYFQYEILLRGWTKTAKIIKMKISEKPCLRVLVYDRTILSRESQQQVERHEYRVVLWLRLFLQLHQTLRH